MAPRCLWWRRERSDALSCKPIRIMMLNFSDDGEPEALWTTDINGSDEAFMDVTLGSLELRVSQPGAAAVSGIGTGALVWQAGPVLADALARAAASKSGILYEGS